MLGSAAGGGAPQWNCACAVCLDGRADRTQDTVAVSGDGTVWYLINAGPDIRSQILRTPDLAPGPGLRQTPVRGVLLTTAELDHTLGLLSLREAVRLEVYATAAVTEALAPVRSMLGHYTDLRWRAMPVRLDGGLDLDRLTVGRKRPRYAADLDGADWVSALRLTDRRTGSSFVYATCLPAWTAEFDAFVAGADQVLLDGTFATEDELTRATGRPGSASSMGHLPMASSRVHAARHPGTRFRYGHVNNTNPSTADVVADGSELLTS
ncbi:coenzyme PQQ synthesis protein B [Paractinoplanes toevensis]|uniref:Coenzyme PQQ synthesis protein B n=1 Tax=Paractinoplanes toevensis TaxID=571911 RepID=A0A919W2D5_9ACTN|nr:coenzyme PQQ synthesis protein B [Actinoplanes toevensis]